MVTLNAVYFCCNKKSPVYINQLWDRQHSRLILKSVFWLTSLYLFGTCLLYLFFCIQSCSHTHLFSIQMHTCWFVRFSVSKWQWEMWVFRKSYSVMLLKSNGGSSTTVMQGLEKSHWSNCLFIFLMYILLPISTTLIIRRGSLTWINPPEWHPKATRNLSADTTWSAKLHKHEVQE